jgi:micrococcal nuclease
MGTTLERVQLMRVFDGDTIAVSIGGKSESVRLVCLDTEESLYGGRKPVTHAGALASAFAKRFFGAATTGVPRRTVRVDLEFDTDDPLDVCDHKHRDNYGRLLAYVHRRGLNYALEAVRRGWSPYFVKYGRSRLYHNQFLAGEAEAQALRAGIWNPTTNGRGPRRDYDVLVPWWALRDGVVEGFRDAPASGAKSVRLDYTALLRAAARGREHCIFVDLQSGVRPWPGGGAVIYAGSPRHPLNLWIEDRTKPRAQAIIQLVRRRYDEHGRGYAYATGSLSLWNGTPQLVLKTRQQLTETAP